MSNKRVDSSVKISPELAENIRLKLKGLMASRGFNLNSLSCAYSEKYGRSMTVQNLGNKINKGTIRYFEVLEIADILGYNIEFKEK
jgi:acetolactate synthase small subunit